jgi:hypothetical protein
LKGGKDKIKDSSRKGEVPSAMAALPKGLVSNTERLSSELRMFGGVDVLDVAKLWRSKLPTG